MMLCIQILFFVLGKDDNTIDPQSFGSDVPEMLSRLVWNKALFLTCVLRALQRPHIQTPENLQFEEQETIY